MHDITARVFQEHDLGLIQEIRIVLSRNGDSTFVCQVYIVPLFFARMCKVRVYSSVAVQSLLKIFILALS